MLMVNTSRGEMKCSGVKKSYQFFPEPLRIWEDIRRTKADAFVLQSALSGGAKPAFRPNRRPWVPSIVRCGHLGGLLARAQ